MPLVHIVTFGCQMNEYDSQRLAGFLEREGYAFTEELEAADIVLFNTCSVRETAETRLMGHLSKLKPIKKQNPNLIIGICGCMGQQHGQAFLKKVPYLDLVMGPRQISEVGSFIHTIQQTRKPLVKTGFDDPYTHEDVVLRKDTVRAYVSIMEGCNHHCSFCIVPLTRGPQVNRPSSEIVEQCRKLADKGYKEITLLGQNVDAWRQQKEHFGDLLCQINELDGIERIRFTSPHPSHISPKVIESIKNAQKVCEWFHLPVQSGSNRILKLMKRVYTKEAFRELVAQIRSHWPEAGITTDFVVGFPGETEEDFQETLHLVQDLRFDNAYCFMFSPRTGTEAATMENQLPLETRQRRIAELIDLQNKIMFERMKEQVGKVFDVMIDGPSGLRDNQWVGRSRSNHHIAFHKDSDLKPGDTVPVKITKAKTHSLVGERVK